MEDLPSCTQCPELTSRRADKAVDPIRGTTNPHARILLLADVPTDEEAVAGAADVLGPLGDWEVVQRAADDAGVDVGSTCAATYAVRCPVELVNRKKLARTEVENCRPWLEREIEASYPDLRVILCLGRLAAASALGVSPAVISKYRGKVHDMEVGGRQVRIVLSVHPYSASTSALEYESLRSDLRRAKVFAQDGYAPFDMERHQQQVASTYELIESEAQLADALAECAASEMVAFDCETRAADPWHLPVHIDEADDDPMLAFRRAVSRTIVEPPQFVTSIQFCPAPGRAFFVPVEHAEFLATRGMLNLLTMFFKGYDGRLVAHNAKFDQVAVGSLLGIVPEVGADTMVLDQVIRGLPARSLKKIAWEVSPYGGYEDEMKEETAASGGRGHDSFFTPFETLFWYGCLDVDVTWRAAQEFLNEVRSTPKLLALSDFLSDASGALARIELDGWRIDTDELERYGDRQRKIIEAVNEWLEKRPAVKAFESTTGKPFNAKSAKMLGTLLYDVLGVTCQVQTPKGEPSTSREALEAVSNASYESAAAHEIVEKVLGMRKADKRISAFYRRWKKGMSDAGRLHFQYNLVKFRDGDTGAGAGTDSGRLSSSGPAGNVQQIPKPDKDPVIRKVFLPDDDDSVLLDVDFSTLEYVVAAIHSGDPKLCAAFKDGYDVHAVVAAEMFDRTPEEMMLKENKPLRSRGKTMNFATLYGAGPQNVAQQLDCPVYEAEEFLKSYKLRFPTLFEWIERIHDDLKKTGVAWSKFGRKRPLPDAQLPNNYGRNRHRIEAAMRRGVNTPIQADASDICLWGLVRLDKWIRETGKRARIKATIHDAVILSVPMDELEEVFDKVVSTLTHPGIDWIDGPGSLGVPLRVSAEVGKNWGELEEVEVE